MQSNWFYTSSPEECPSWLDIPQSQSSACSEDHKSSTYIKLVVLESKSFDYGSHCSKITEARFECIFVYTFCFEYIFVGHTLQIVR